MRFPDPRHAEPVSAPIAPSGPTAREEKWALEPSHAEGMKQVQGDEVPK
jgi:hypothetical protein